MILSHITYILKILTDLCLIKLNISAKNTSAEIIYNVLE